MSRGNSYLDKRAQTFSINGHKLSDMAWGMWRFVGHELKDAQALVEAAISVEINIFDTADIYGFKASHGFGEAERLLGDVLRLAPHLRSKMILATKAGIRPSFPYDQCHEYLLAALEASLTRLGVDHIDLWQIHRPDILTHPADLAKTLEAVLKSGKVGTIGVSNFSIAQTVALQSFMTTPIVTLQPEISPVHIEAFENGFLDHAMMTQTAVLAWSPLGNGRILDPRTPQDIAVALALDAIASQQNVSRSVVAYSWLMLHPAGIIPIIGTQKVERIKEALEARRVLWTRKDWYSVLTAARHEPLP